MRRDSRKPQVLAFVRECIDQTGRAPTCKEAGDAVGISAVAAWKHFQRLVKDGKLVKRPDRSVDLAPADLRGVRSDDLRGELARRGVTMEALDEPALPMNRGRPCAANFCDERVPRGRLMCRNHWFQLPRDMRSAILNAWSARQMQAYGEAVEAARDYLGGFTKVVERVE